MATARDLLHRFRPAGAPGAAGATGVPAGRGADPTAELLPVFARLTATDRDCALILEQARAAAGQVRAGAADRARALVVAAGQRVDSERAAVAAQARRRGKDESARTLATAAKEAEQVRRRAAERLPSEVEAVLTAVQALVDGSGRDLSSPGAEDGARNDAGPGAT
jgi:hypothetical protein